MTSRILLLTHAQWTDSTERPSVDYTESTDSTDSTHCVQLYSDRFHTFYSWSTVVYSCRIHYTQLALTNLGSGLWDGSWGICHLWTTHCSWASEWMRGKWGPARVFFGAFDFFKYPLISPSKPIFHSFFGISGVLTHGELLSEWVRFISAFSAYFHEKAFKSHRKWAVFKSSSMIF